MSRGRPLAPCLRHVECYLKDTGMVGTFLLRMPPCLTWRDLCGNQRNYTEKFEVSVNFLWSFLELLRSICGMFVWEFHKFHTKCGKFIKHFFGNSTYYFVSWNDQKVCQIFYFRINRSPLQNWKCAKQRISRWTISYEKIMTYRWTFGQLRLRIGLLED